jgi:hypothetical protein
MEMARRGELLQEVAALRAYFPLAGRKMRVSPLAAELSRAEHLSPRIVCGSKPLKTTMEVSDRRESERFPIMRCNRLRPWLLRILYPLAPLANRRETLRFGARVSGNPRNYIILLTR